MRLQAVGAQHMGEDTDITASERLHKKMEAGKTAIRKDRPISFLHKELHEIQASSFCFI